MTLQPAFDVHADEIALHERIARKRAEWVFTVVMTPTGVNMRHLCDEASAQLADQVTMMQRASAEFGVTDPDTLRRAETAIVDAFQARMGELLDRAKTNNTA